MTFWPEKGKEEIIENLDRLHTTQLEDLMWIVRKMVGDIECLPWENHSSARKVKT